MKKHLSIIIWVLSMPLAIAQIRLNQPNTTHATPTAASLTKYAETPVDLYTGIANIGVPIYQIKVRDAQLGISLGYHSGGIKVDEEASIVGLGWSLQAGGVISRQIVGGDDYSEHSSRTQYFDAGMNLPAGSSQLVEIPRSAQVTNFVNYGCDINFNGSSTDPAVVSAIHPFIKKPASDQAFQTDFVSGTWEAMMPQSPYDFLPDLYNFNFDGYSGKFIINRDKSVSLESKSKIKIIPPVDKNGIFEIIAPNGARYKFGAVETFSDLDVPNMANLYKSINVPISWFLTEIISPLGEKITLTYVPYEKQTRSLQGINQIHQLPGFNVETHEGNSKIYICEGYTTVTLGQNKNKTNGQYLSAISFATGAIDFVYSTVAEREDLDQEKYLKKIILKRKNANNTFTPVKEFVLSHGYFNSWTYLPVEDDDYTLQQGSSFFAENFRNKRLKLLSFQEKSLLNTSVMVPPYWFEYYEGFSDGNKYFLPQKTSFAKDFWGFSNGCFEDTFGPNSFGFVKSNNKVLYPTIFDEVYYKAASERGKGPRDSEDNFIPDFKKLVLYPGADRMPDPNHIRSWSLRKINYPEGGSTEYEYDGNEFRPEPDLFLGKKIWTTKKRVVKSEANLNASVYEFDLDLSNVRHPLNTIQDVKTELKLTGKIIFNGNVCNESLWYNDSGFKLNTNDVARVVVYDVNNPIDSEVLLDFKNFAFSANPTPDLDLNTLLVCDSDNNATISNSVVNFPIKTFNKLGKNYKVKVEVPARWLETRSAGGVSAKIQKIDLRLEWFDTALDKYYGNGQRIKSITVNDNFDANRTKKINYDYSKKIAEAGTITNLSQGRLHAPPFNHYYEFKLRSAVTCVKSGYEFEDYTDNIPLFVHSKLYRVPCTPEQGTQCYQGYKTVYVETEDRYMNDLFGSPTDKCQYNLQTCRNLLISSENQNGFMSYVGYDNVVETINSSGEMGAIQYSFSNEKPTLYAYNEAVTTREGPIGLPRRPATFSGFKKPLNGSLDTKMSFQFLAQDSYRLVEKVSNQYMIDVNPSKVWGIEKNAFFSDYDHNGGVFKAFSFACDVKTLIMPLMQSYWLRNIKSESSKYYYDAGLETVLKETSIIKYENEAHLQPTAVIKENSDGRKLISWNLYPEDYNLLAGGFLKQMVDKNVVSTPVESVTGIINTSLTMDQLNTTNISSLINNISILSGSLNTQKLNSAFSNSDCIGCTTTYPDKTYLAEFSQPIPFSSFRFSNQIGSNDYPFGASLSWPFSLNTSYYKPRVDYQEYDSKNNLKKFSVLSEQGLTQTTEMEWTGPFMTKVIKNSNLSANAPSISQTFEFDPLFGLTKQTDDNGISQGYYHDDLGRLKEIRRITNTGVNELLKSYQYNYGQASSVASIASPNTNTVSQVNTFNAVGDSVARKITLDISYTGANFKYFEIYKSKNGEEFEYYKTVLPSQNSLVDFYISYNSKYEYKLKPVLSDGSTMNWIYSNTLNLSNGCYANGVLTRTLPIRGTFDTIDEACDEVNLEEGFETDDTGSYEARVK